MTIADPAYTAPNVVTLLTAKGKRLTKKIALAGVQPADKPLLFTHDAEPVADLKDLCGLLHWLNDKTDMIIVRPAVIEGAPTEIRRMSTPGYPDRGLIDVPRSWIMVDIDLPVIRFPRSWRRNPERHIRELVKAALPEAFHGAGVIAQFSSQMRADGGTPRVHLWFWLDRPLISSAAKGWLKGSPIDNAVFNRGQPHYTAAPIFEGSVDPLGEQRLKFLPGPAVEVPEGINTSAPEEVEVDLSVDLSDYVNPDLHDNRWRREVLKTGDHEGGKGFHFGILHAAMAFIRCRYDPQAADPLAGIDYAEFEQAMLEHVSTLKDLPPDRQASLQSALRDMPRCFWGAVPKVQHEIRKRGILAAAFTSVPRLPQGQRPSMLDVYLKRKASRDVAP